MKSHTLTQILSNELNATQEDHRWQLPIGTKVTVFLNTPSTLFPVGRVVALTLGTDYVSLESEEGRVFTDLSEITAIRVDQEAKAKGEARLGFGN